MNPGQTVEVGQTEQPQVILHEFRSDCVEAGQSEWPQPCMNLMLYELRSDCGSRSD